MKKLLIIVLSLFLALPFPALAAIAFDQSTTTDSVVNTTSYTTPSFTVTSNNPILIAQWNQQTNLITENNPTCSWDGQSMTLTYDLGVACQGATQCRNGAIFVLQAPPSGTHTATCTSSNSVRQVVQFVSYSGAAQSGQFDAASSTSINGRNIIGATSTSVMANDWAVSTLNDAQGSGAASTNVNVVRENYAGNPNTTMIGDTNGTIGGAGTAITSKWTISAGTQGRWSTILLIAPFVAPIISGPPIFYLGNGALKIIGGSLRII